MTYRAHDIKLDTSLGNLGMIKQMIEFFVSPKKAVHITDVLISNCVWFSCTPMPDDWIEFSIKDDAAWVLKSIPQTMYKGPIDVQA